MTTVPLGSMMLRVKGSRTLESPSATVAESRSRPDVCSWAKSAELESGVQVSLAVLEESVAICSWQVGLPALSEESGRRGRSQGLSQLVLG